MAHTVVSGEFEYQNGRRYHGYRRGAYMYPNDEKECDRLDIYHKMFSVARYGELHRAPVHNYPSPRILDLGTGTGIWAIDMADKYPESEVIGIDLSLIQPKWIPRNLRFLISDFESEWTLGKDSFDLIHLRIGVGSVSSYPNLFRRVFEHLRPAYGWFEYIDIDINARSDDNSLSADTSLYQWQHRVLDATDRSGKPLRYEYRTGQMLREAGFVDVQEVVIPVPVGPWASDPHMKDLGRWYALGVHEGLEALTMGPLTRVEGWTADQVRQYLKPVQKELIGKDGRKVHAYCEMHVWIARKP